MSRRATCFVAAIAAFAAPPAAANGPRTDTLTAWHGYVADAVLRLHGPGEPGSDGEPVGQVIDVPGGAIHHWRGSTVAPRTTVGAVVAALMYPGTPPPQDDVLESRVLHRSGDRLRVYLKLARSAIMTAVYDTEHEVLFRRHSARLATSQSVSTRIAERGGPDRGFLWRLNSYWRYTQVGSDVRIDLESLSLSRDVPTLARPIARPIINRIGRESVTRTLLSVRRFLEGR